MEPHVAEPASSVDLMILRKRCAASLIGSSEQGRDPICTSAFARLRYDAGNRLAQRAEALMLSRVRIRLVRLTR
jgi:hypothetical protein